MIHDRICKLMRVAAFTVLVLAMRAGIRASARDEALGALQPAGPFQVTLPTETCAPRAGTNRFHVDLAHHQLLRAVGTLTLDAGAGLVPVTTPAP